MPVALAAGVAGSLAGGVVASPFGQAAADTASAFVGPFAFVFTAGLVAPSAARQKVGIAATALVAILALGTFVLSTFANVEEFSQLSERARILTPVAQFLGAVYALFIFPPLVTAGSTLERLWREILSLGILVAMFGAALVISGLVARLMGRGWFVLEVGLGVLVLGAVTWVFPFLQATVRVAKLQR